MVVSQTAMVLVGSIAPALRWINATGYRKSDGFGNCREEFGVEKFWVQRLEEWKDDPLPEYCCFSNRSVTKGLYLFRNATLDVCISFQKQHFGSVKLFALHRLCWHFYLGLCVTSLALRKRGQ